MAVRLVLILVFALGLPSAYATLDLVSLETFQGVGTLNSSNPGNLGTVNGNFYKRAGGPLVSGATPAASGDGWSADLQGGTPYHSFSASGTTSNMICGWYYFGSLFSDEVKGRQLNTVWASMSNGQTLLSISIIDSLSLCTSSSFQSNTSTPVTITPGWYFLALAWVYNPGVPGVSQSSAEYAAYYMPLGGTLAQLGSTITVSNPQSFSANGGLFTPTGNIRLQCRYGSAGYYSIGTLSDVAYPPGITAPTVDRRNWYINPASGSDTNDGTTPSSAWQSVAKLDAESANLGMFPGASYSAGDILNIDCSTAPLPIGSTAIRIYTPGLSVLQTGGALDPMTTLAPFNWSAVNGSTNTYSTTDCGATDLLSTVIFENGVYPNKVTASSFSASSATTTASTTTYGSVLSALDAVPGSFYVDADASTGAGTIYYHPFGDTNPASDGKTYRRTRYREGIGASAVYVNAPNVWWDGLIIAGTTLADKATNDPVGSYCFQWDSGAGGTNLLSNFNVNHFSKHGVGRTSGGSNMICTRQNGVYGQASPYAPWLGTTADVDFSGDSTSANNVANYINCTETANLGAIGSSAGVASPSTQFWTSHASSVAFSNINVTGCNQIGLWVEQGECSQMTFTQCPALGSVTCSHNLSMQGCLVNGTATSSSNDSSEATILTNCIIAPPATTNGNPSLSTLSLNATFTGCVFDLTKPNGYYLFTRSATGSTLTVRDCLMILPAAAALLNGYSNSDTITMDHNAYQLGADALVCNNYDDGTTAAGRTLAQWQTLGFDTASFATADPMIAANYSPEAGSPLIGAGADIGPFPDFTGTVFQVRDDIGAYEYVVPTPVITSATNVSGQVGQPFSYQIAATNSPDTFDAVNLPAGLSIDDSGLISGTPQQAGTFQPTISATNPGGTGSITLTISVSSPFAVWQQSWFGSADSSVSGANATPAGDGIANLLKYALNLDPNTDGSSGLPAQSLVTNAGQNYLALAYTQVQAATDLTYTVQVSSDLQTWYSGTGYTAAPSITNNADGETQTVTVQDLTPVTDAAQRFIRLEVTLF